MDDVDQGDDGGALVHELRAYLVLQLGDQRSARELRAVYARLVRDGELESALEATITIASQLQDALSERDGLGAIIAAAIDLELLLRPQFA